MSTFKDYLGSKDVKWWNGVARTFARLTSSGGTLTQNMIGSVVDILEVYGSGTAYTDAPLSTAIRAIGSNACTILFQPGTWVISNDVTIPSTMSIMLPQGAVLSVATGKTLTISGSIIAGSYVIFDGNGTIGGSPILTFKDSYWFSGTITDSTTPTYKTATHGTINTDTIAEKTAAAGVTIDGVKLKDSQPYCDVINEKTAATGVTVDGVKLMDGAVTASGAVQGLSLVSDIVSEKSSGVGVTVDGVLLRDGGITATSPVIASKLLKSITVITSGSGNYTPAAGINSILVELVGGGGAGGGATATSGGEVSVGAGGSGGGYLRKFFTGVGGGSFAYEVGAGGAGVSADAGNAGGDTTFTGPGAVLLTGVGGGGGSKASAAAPPIVIGVPSVGAATNGDINISGQVSRGGKGIATNVVIGGAGANSMLGAGGIEPAITSSGINGYNATGYGAGGSGSANTPSQTAKTGGNGSSGIIIIYEY